MLMSGQLPFTSRSDLFQEIVDGHVEFKEEQWSVVSKEAIDFILKMLTVDPEERFLRPTTFENWMRESEIATVQPTCKTKLPSCFGIIF